MPDSVLSSEFPATFDASLDITALTCPMTFVRTRLALDTLAPGQVLRVLLKGAEPFASVPRAAEELGHAIVGRTGDGSGNTVLWIRKATPAS